MRRFFSRTGQALLQPWMVEMVKRMLKGLPVSLLTRMGLATLIAPRTSDWSKASSALQEYIDEQEEKQAQALSLAELVETAKQDEQVPCEVYSRIVGYVRPVRNWNKGKKQEFVERRTYKVNEKAAE